ECSLAAIFPRGNMRIKNPETNISKCLWYKVQLFWFTLFTGGHDFYKILDKIKNTLYNDNANNLH
ncbi:MAG: hypothetical protein E7D50_07740, partial [Finegoldia magna]|nr:hypothetical protein [Finegoldia magna]